jgi:MFS family permease
MALTTYVRHIAPPNEHTPTLSMGVAMNHVAAVAMPLVGGYVWKYFNYKWTFAIGAIAAAVSILAASSLPIRRKLLAPEAVGGGEPRG